MPPALYLFFRDNTLLFRNDQVLSILDLHDLVHSSLMTAAFEFGRKPLVTDHLGHFHADDAGAEGNDVGVIMHL